MFFIFPWQKQTSKNPRPNILEPQTKLLRTIGGPVLKFPGDHWLQLSDQIDLVAVDAATKPILPRITTLVVRDCERRVFFKTPTHFEHISLRVNVVLPRLMRQARDAYEAQQGAYPKLISSNAPGQFSESLPQVAGRRKSKNSR